MNTFYRPGILEMVLHGMFGRHSWFANQYQDRLGRDRLTVSCRICYMEKPEAPDAQPSHVSPS